jgi:hypothetical protein
MATPMAITAATQPSIHNQPRELGRDSRELTTREGVPEPSMVTLPSSVIKIWVVAADADEEGIAAVTLPRSSLGKGAAGSKGEKRGSASGWVVGALGLWFLGLGFLAILGSRGLTQRRGGTGTQRDDLAVFESMNVGE